MAVPAAGTALSRLWSASAVPALWTYLGSLAVPPSSRHRWKPLTLITSQNLALTNAFFVALSPPSRAARMLRRT